MIFFVSSKNRNTLFLGYAFDSAILKFYKIDERFREFNKQFFRFILTRSALSDSADSASWLFRQKLAELRLDFYLLFLKSWKSWKSWNSMKSRDCSNHRLNSEDFDSQVCQDSVLPNFFRTGWKMKMSCGREILFYFDLVLKFETRKTMKF